MFFFPSVFFSLSLGGPLNLVLVGRIPYERDSFLTGLRATESRIDWPCLYLVESALSREHHHQLSQDFVIAWCQTLTPLSKTKTWHPTQTKDGDGKRLSFYYEADDSSPAMFSHFGPFDRS